MPTFFFARMFPRASNMTQHDPISDRILRIAEPVCASAGYEVVDVKFTKDSGGWVLRVFIDKPAVEGTAEEGDAALGQVDLNDCERISRELSAVLDVEDPIPQAYSLEVSSPGIDRPLRTLEHFRRFVDAEVKIVMSVPVPSLRPTPGASDRRNFRGFLVGVDEHDGDPRVSIEIDGKDVYQLRLADIEQARLVPDWDAVMKGGSGVHRRGEQTPEKTGKKTPRG